MHQKLCSVCSCFILIPSLHHLRELPMKRALASCLTASLLLVGLLAAQDAIRRGKIKSADPTKGTVTITADGQDHEFSIGSETRLRDAGDQPITSFKEKGLPAGADVMFKAERRGDQQVL